MSSTSSTRPGRMQLDDLHVFATVARLRSFRQASLVLGVTPSAISHTLKGLEERVGVRLLNRTTRSVTPSEAGQRLLDRLAPALRDVAEALDAVDSFRDSPQGTLRINAPRTAAETVVTPLVTQYLRENPGMHVELVADDALVDIVEKGFDAGVRFGESLAQDMVAMPIGPRQRFVVVASPAYVAAHGVPKHPKDLAQHACVRIRFPHGGLYSWEFAKGKKALNVSVNGPLTVGEMPLSVRAAADGIGLAYVYSQCAQPLLDTGELVTVLDDWCPTIPGFYLYYPSRRLMPAGFKAFVDLVRRSTSD